MFRFFCGSEDPRSSRGSHSRSSNYCVCDGRCTQTHPAHNTCTFCLRTSAHIFMRVTHTHGSSVHKCWSYAHVVSLLTSPSPFSRFTHLRLLFLHSHFETTSPTHPVTRSCRAFPTQKLGSSVLCTRTSSLATWPSPRGLLHAAPVASLETMSFFQVPTVGQHVEVRGSSTVGRKSSQASRADPLSATAVSISSLPEASGPERSQTRSDNSSTKVSTRRTWSA